MNPTHTHLIAVHPEQILSMIEEHERAFGLTLTREERDNLVRTVDFENLSSALLEGFYASVNVDLFSTISRIHEQGAVPHGELQV